MTSRRNFIRTSAAVAAAGWIGVAQAADIPATAQKLTYLDSLHPNGACVQPPLPYAMNALEPFLTERQVSFHYARHHAGYFKNLATLTSGKPEATLVQIIKEGDGALYNNAAQAFNHTFFWHCIAPTIAPASQPSPELAAAIATAFGDIATMKETLIKTAVGQFGSGWGWLVKKPDGSLVIVATGNAGCPLNPRDKASHGFPLLTVDVWEHAYYLDYQNDRAKFVTAFTDHINWDFVSKNFAASQV
ncbi:MAG: superoxide dismutase [Thermoguttaceae bacterium]